VKPSLENVLRCASEIQKCNTVLESPERHHFDPISLEIWQMDWVAELHRELAVKS
jgi:hypothetical protein